MRESASSRPDAIALERASVVAVARTWRDTPYHTGAAIPGVGADCLTFVVAVYRQSGLIPDVEVPHYPPDWHLHREDERYLKGVLRFCNEIEWDQEPLPGDLVMWRFGRAFAHGSIVTAWPRLIHAYVHRLLSEDDVTQAAWLTTIGEAVPEQGKPRPRKLLRLKRWM